MVDNGEDERSEPWARWPWQRCEARWSRFGLTRRCDLKKRHDGSHLAEGGMDDIRWSEQYPLDDAVPLLAEFWLQGPTTDADMTNEEVAWADARAQDQYLTERGYAVVHIGRTEAQP